MSPIPSSFCSEFCSRRNKCLISLGGILLGILVGIVAVAIFIITGYFPCKYLDIAIGPCPKNWSDGIFLDGLLYCCYGFFWIYMGITALLIPVGIIVGIYYTIKCTNKACKEAKRRAEGFMESDIQ